jgi:DNA-binding beta-propeller fold protein YncE
MGIGIRTLGRVSAFLASLAILVASCGGRAAAPSTAPTTSPAPPAYELWVVDQAETTPTGGGTLYIYKGADLSGAAPAPAYTVNLGEAALGVGDGIGKHGHSIAFNPAMTHAVISFVDSGHVQVIRAADRKVVASIKMTGNAAVGPAAPHASAVTPAGDAIIVANQGGKRLQRISADFKNDVYKLDSAADLDLSLLEDADHPGNLPVIPVFTPDARYVYVPMRGGGSYVVDYQSTPMKTVATLGKSAIGPQSCCATFVKDTLWTTAQGGATTTTTSFNLYQVSGLPDKPVAKKILSRTGNVESHSVILVGQYLWLADRFANTLDIVDQSGDAKTMSLASGPLAGRDPAPDIMALSPDESTVFVALRGKTPVTSNIKGLDNAVGDVGGFAILTVKDGGRDAVVRSVVALPLAAGASVVDPHGLRIRMIK